MNIELSVITEEKAWKSVPSVNKKTISKIIKEVLNSFPAFKNTVVEVAVLLTNDAKMQKLNLEFLKKDKPTNILSFPDQDINKEDLSISYADNLHSYIGDIALGFETVKLEAEENNIDIYNHVTHLLIHGILHLIGYDHIVEEEAMEMQNLEIEFLKNFGIKSPY